MQNASCVFQSVAIIAYHIISLASLRSTDITESCNDEYTVKHASSDVVIKTKDRESRQIPGNTGDGR